MKKCTSLTLIDRGVEDATGPNDTTQTVEMTLKYCKLKQLVKQVVVTKLAEAEFCSLPLRR